MKIEGIVASQDGQVDVIYEGSTASWEQSLGVGTFSDLLHGNKSSIRGPELGTPPGERDQPPCQLDDTGLHMGNVEAWRGSAEPSAGALPAQVPSQDSPQRNQHAAPRWGGPREKWYVLWNSPAWG